MAKINKPKVFVHAPNIHQGGGAVLLNEFLSVIPSEQPAIVTLDKRMALNPNLSLHIEILRVQTSVGNRLMAERWLQKKVEDSDIVICFGNLPPIFRLKGKVSVFLQNRYLVDDYAPLCALPIKPRIRLHMERIWLKLFRRHATSFFVQTPSMKRLTEDCLRVPAICLPFLPKNLISSISTTSCSRPVKFDFLYVASGEAHKNHVTLIGAWLLLAAEGIFPSLALTLSETISPDLVKRIEVKRAEAGLNIHFLGVLNHDELLLKYHEANALIYPSGFESFGLPLIEAKLAGLPVLAPELDYVRDILDPVESFEPRSPLSIARAVKRFLKLEQPAFKPEDARIFFHHVMSGGQS